ARSPESPAIGGDPMIPRPQDGGSGFHLLPEQASTFSAKVDGLTLYLLVITVLFSALIFALVFLFAIRYRRRAGHETAHRVGPNTALEVAWMGIPFLLTLVMFVWGARLYMGAYRAPANAMDVYVVAKQ